MRIGFWNTQSGNPLAIADGDKGVEVARIVAAQNVDVMIFCEVLDLALDYADIKAIKRDIVFQTEADIRGMPGPSTGGMHALAAAGAAIGYEHNPDSRRKYKFRKGTEQVRASGGDMAVIEMAASSSSDPAASSRRSALMRQPSIMATLDGVGFKGDLFGEFPEYEGRDVIQANRNYMVFSKAPLNLYYLDVLVSGAKREICAIDVAGMTILAVHAPSYGKGGAETVEQISALIAAAGQPTIGIGDFNIDVDELIITTEVDGKATGRSDDLQHMRRRHGVDFYCGGFPSPFGIPGFARRWQPGRGPITKTNAPTQKSGGTLDYVVAPVGAVINVTIVDDTMNIFSDHAMIVAEF